MTKRILTSYATFITMAVVLVIAGVMTVHASEVTGTLSSGTSDDSQTSGDIGGTVSDDTQPSGNIGGTVLGDSSRSGGSRSGGSSGSSDTSSGSVLGAAVESTTQTPSFPNAGTAPEASSADHLLWSAVVSFIKSVFSF